jgi:hypothetical protein
MNVFETDSKSDVLSAFFCKDGKHIGAITSDRRLLLAEYFPWQSSKLPGDENIALERRLEAWKRQQRIDSAITLQDVSWH